LSDFAASISNSLLNLSKAELFNLKALSDSHVKQYLTEIAEELGPKLKLSNAQALEVLKLAYQCRPDQLFKMLARLEELLVEDSAKVDSLQQKLKVIERFQLFVVFFKS
jgi:hypothetical protein